MEWMTREAFADGPGLLLHDDIFVGGREAKNRVGSAEDGDEQKRESARKCEWTFHMNLL